MQLLTNINCLFPEDNSKTFYYTSFNYVNQEGIVKNTSFERLGARLNLKSDINEKLKIGMNVTGSYMKDHFVANGFGVNENAGVMYTAYNYDQQYQLKMRKAIMLHHLS